MEVKPSDSTAADAAHEEIATIYGYKRLRFFEIRFWEFFVLVAAVLALALALFPRHKMLVSFYLDKGMQTEALTLIRDMLDDAPGDADLLKLSADVHLSRHDGDAAIASLNKALAIDPNDAKVLAKLVTLYEWNRNPRQALKTMERLAQLNPDDFTLHLRLQDYYRYYGDAEREASVVFHLIRLERRLPYTSVYGDTEGEDVIFRIIRDPFVKGASAELRRISLRNLSDPDNPYLMEAARQLWAVRQQYINWIRENETENPEDGLAYITRFLEIQVRMGMFQDAGELAQRLDAERKSGGGIQLLLVRVLRWHAMNTEALELLAELRRNDPTEIEFLTLLVDVARQNNDPAMAVSALEAAVAIQPENQTLLQRLIALFGEIDQPVKAYRIQKKLVALEGNARKDLSDLLALSRATSRLDLMQEAAHMVMDFQGANHQLLAEAARTILETGDELGAITAYEKVVSDDPEDTSAVFQLADLYRWNGRYENAYKILKSNALSTEGRKESITRMLQAAGESGNADLLIDGLETAIGFYPDNPSYRLRLGDIYFADGRLSEAAGAYTAYLGRYPEDQKIVKRLAETFYALGRPQKAISLLQRHVQNHPDDTDAVKRLSDYYVWTGRSAEAFDLLIHSSRNVAISPERMLNLLETAGGLQDRQRINLVVNMAKNKYPKHPAILKKIAELLLSVNDTSRAIAAYRTLLRLEPENTEALEQIIQLSLWSKNPEDALPWLDRRFDGAELNSELALQASSWYLDAGSLRKAIEYTEHASALRPEDERLRRRLLEYYRWDGRQKEIMATLESLNASGALTSEEKLELAKGYAADRKWREVIGLLAPDQKVGRLDIDGELLLVSAYENTMRQEAARALFGQLMKKYKGRDKALKEIGAIAFAHGRLDTALEFFETALKINPLNPDALKGSGQIYARKGKPRLAISRLEAYNRLKPLDYETRYQLGELYYFNGREAGALREYRKTMAIIGKAE